MSAPSLPSTGHDIPSFLLPSHRASRRGAGREDVIFRVILPRSRAALADFESADDWDEQVLAEGDIIAPLIN